MKYEKALATLVELEDEDIVTASGECMDNVNMAEEMGVPYVCDTVKPSQL